MVISDVINGIKKKKCVVLEDPVNGSKFLDDTTKLMRSYAVHYVYSNGNMQLDISKIRKFKLKEEDGTSFVSFDSNINVPFSEGTDIVVLQKINNITKDIADIMEKKFKFDLTRVFASNIYAINVISMEDITPNIVAENYPYVFNETKFVNGTYTSSVRILYNSDVLMPRLIYTDSDPTYIKPVLSSSNFVVRYLDYANMGYILNGEYLRTPDTVLRLIDISDGIFIFKDVLSGDIMYIKSPDAGELILDCDIISNKYLCVKMTKENEYLFYYGFANEENKAQYDKAKLKEIYDNILKENKLQDSPLYIVNGDTSMVYASINDIITEEDYDDEEDDEDE